MQDLSDTANCFVGHPDTILSNGMVKYTNETRGSLKKLLPTCKQPSAEEIAREKHEVRLFSLTVNRPVWNIQGRGNRSLSNLQAKERPIRRYSGEQREGIFVDGNGCLDRHDGDTAAPAWVQELAQRAATEMVEVLPGLEWRCSRMIGRRWKK